jgi:hypothetical protein
MSRNRGIVADWVCAGVVAALVLASGQGCSKKPKEEPAAAGKAPPAATPQLTAASSIELCNFKDGPSDAPVKVEAYYPGRHEDTLAAVKTLLTTFPGKVQVEIVDWRTPEGMKRRDATGLVCAGVVINGKNAFDLVVEGKPSKVLFVRGINGEWTNADLEAAVRHELAANERR